MEGMATPVAAAHSAPESVSPELAPRPPAAVVVVVVGPRRGSRPGATLGVVWVGRFDPTSTATGNRPRESPVADEREQRGWHAGARSERPLELPSRQLEHRPDLRVGRVGVRQARRRRPMLSMTSLWGRVRRIRRGERDLAQVQTITVHARSPRCKRAATAAGADLIHRPVPIPHPDQHFPASRERPEERTPSPLTLTRPKSGWA